MRIINDDGIILSENLENYSKRLAHLIGEYIYLMKNNEQYSYEMEDYMRQNKELKKQLDDCHKELTKCLENEKNVNLTTDNKELVKKLEDLLATCERQIENLSKELKKCQEENQSLKKELQECKNPTHDDEKNIVQDQDSFNIDSQKRGAPQESDLLQAIFAQHNIIADLDNLPVDPSPEELEKLKKEYIKHTDNVTDANMIKINILK